MRCHEHCEPRYVYTVSFPGGIQIDKAGNIAFCDQVNQVVDSSPTRKQCFRKPGVDDAANGIDLPIGDCNTCSGTSLYTADPGGSGLAEDYKYTAGGAAENTIAVGGQPIGIAVTPPLSKENN